MQYYPKHLARNRLTQVKGSKTSNIIQSKNAILYDIQHARNLT